MRRSRPPATHEVALLEAPGQAARRLGRAWRRLVEVTEPVDRATRDRLAARWAELPARSQTFGQTLGRHALGCEGTHGVFPRCNFSCSPCYHAKEANRVRVDGPHTLDAVRAQMATFAELRGPTGHAQLIGGEVTHLEPADHAAVLDAMQAAGRTPMSMTHGDFDYDHLKAIAVGPDGRRRWRRISFAGHFDTTMVGRSGIRRTEREADLDPAREAFCAMFARLRRDHGVRPYLAHNMTVVPANVDQIPDVVRSAVGMGFSMLSFQPAAHVGRRWDDSYAALDGDSVWGRIEEGVGTRLDWRTLQVGDDRCNRTAWGFFVGERWHPLLDSDDGRDLAARDAFFARFGGIHFNAPAPLLAARLARATLRHPSSVALAVGWLARAVRRVGLRPLLSHRPVPMTFVMHSFMGVDEVAPAWELMERGERASDPAVAATQERLAACSYAMAHPETGRLVPACVQHCLLDPAENAALAVALPLPTVRSAPRHTAGATPGA